ncbi:serine hydrolase domain-containing protein [Sphingomonas sp. 1P06PA]|uniref:serine hydrolase domain-containing protein n=1 Tax=Sphingomonas sp. 1P06PA TaxID=554121 RepID=UPI0039A680C5
MKLLLAAISIAASSIALSAAIAQAAPQAAAMPVGSDATIVAPEGWAVARSAGIVRFTPPEKDLQVAIAPVASAKDGKDAAAQAWRQVRPAFAWPVRLVQPVPARDGWDEAFVIDYEVPPAEKAIAQAVALRHGTRWTVLALEGAIATIDKRSGQFDASADTLRPAGYVKESFAGKTAHRMDASRIAELKRFVQSAMTELKIPGVGLAVIDGDRIAYEGGIGVKDVASGAPVGKDTLFMIASNTKGMSTLLLSTLVDQGRLDWNRPVIDYMPSFRLGNAETTRKVLVKHLVCACTGLPRKDMEWLYNTRPDTGPEETFRQLAATQPTSGFGETFQYNNLMASAAGYLAAHILYPELPLDEGYDRAMRERVFEPLGMRATTFSNAQAMQGDWAKPYDVDLEDRLQPVDMKYNDTVVPYRPAGGAWSSAHDMALYVRDELDEGALPGGQRFASAESVLARRVHNVPTGENIWYGMGLEDDASKGVSVIQHGGSLFGYKSNWFAVPSAKVGVVVLTNSESGYTLANGVKRRLLELLYDGKPEAVENVKLAAKRAQAQAAKTNSEIDRDVSAAEAAPFVGDYASTELGPLAIRYDQGRLTMRATSIWSDLAPRRNKDGTTSLVTTSPGFIGLELLARPANGRQALVLNDAQHEYMFVATKP